jgi:hypothetical protein
MLGGGPNYHLTLRLGPLHAPLTLILVLRWKSVLTRTGMFQGGANDETNPADMVVEDLLEWYAKAQEVHA